MNAAVCTLFEADYHYGVAGLVNSLIASGFSGTLFAGFRGPLPPWCGNESQSGSVSGDSPLVSVADNVSIHFILLETVNHLTNYKPDFMLDLLAGPAAGCDALLYMDPDIVLGENWRYIEDAISCGVTLCEDVNSPVSEFHPRRIGWRRYYSTHGHSLTFKSSSYVNGGFVGLKASHAGFLKLWKSLQELMFMETGGGDKSALSGGEQSLSNTGFADCFGKTDQDALNATVEAYMEPVSILGRDAMAFKPGRTVAPHAIGPRKPWKAHYLQDALRGFAPRAVDKLFWKHMVGPIKPFPGSAVRAKQLAIGASSLTGRGVRRAW